MSNESKTERDGNLGEIIDRRVQVYGDPAESFALVAQNWSSILGHEVQAWQVPVMMIGLKSVRMRTSPDYSDHSDDIEGYLDIFRQIIGDDMIIARSVTEYIEKKWPADAEPSVRDQVLEAVEQPQNTGRSDWKVRVDRPCTESTTSMVGTFVCELPAEHGMYHFHSTIGSWT